MAFWRVGSVAWTAVTAWAATTSQAAGVLRRQLAAPTVNNERVFVCIVAGTTLGSEPAWTLTKGAKTAEAAGPTWQECTGQPGVNGDLTNCPLSSSVRSTTPALGAVIQNNAGTYLFIMSTSGACGAGEPSYTLTAGVTTADSSGTWTCLGAVGGFGVAAAPHARLAAALTATWGAAGDTFFVNDNHAETQAANTTLACPGTSAAQCYVYSVDHTVGSPVASSILAGAIVTTTGAFTLTINGGGYFYGITFQCGSGAVTSALTVGTSGGSGTLIFDTCALQKLGTTANTGAFAFSTSCVVWFRNTTIQFGSTGDGIRNLSDLRWISTASAITGSTFPTTLFARNASGGSVYINGVDLSAIGSATLVGTAGGVQRVTIVNCKLGSGYVIAGAIVPGSIVDVINSDSGATNYIHSRNSLEGSQVVNTALVRTTGASDGTTSISWQIATTSSANWVGPFETMPLPEWNAVLSSNVAVTCYGIWNSSSLPNTDQIWLHVQYLGSSATPITSAKSQTKATALSAGVALPADTSAWDSAATARANTTAYVVGNVIKVASNPGRVFFCTTSGTSSGSEPGGYASAVDGGSVTDNSAVFRAGMRFALTVTLSSPQPALAGFIYPSIKAGAASSTFWVDPKAILA